MSIYMKVILESKKKRLELELLDINLRSRRAKELENLIHLTENSINSNA